MNTLEAVRASLDHEWRSQREIWKRVGLGAEHSMRFYLMRLVQGGDAEHRMADQPSHRGGPRNEYRRAANASP